MVTVRARLIAWYGALLLLGLMAFGGVVLWQVHQQAIAALDASMQRRAQDMEDELQFGQTITLRHDAPKENTGKLGDTTIWIRVLDSVGNVVLREGPTLSGVPSIVLAQQKGGTYDLEQVQRVHLRMYVLPVARGNRRVATVQVFATIDPIDAAFQQIVVTMGVAGVLVLAVAAVGGVWLADRTLRPIATLTRVAQRIGASDLHQRVSVEVWRARRVPADEMGQLARTFDGMLARLEEASERRRQFTADAAHELCTPIATITSSAEVLLRQPRQPEDYQNALQHILAESRHMGRIVDDLLLLARVDADQMPLENELVEIDDVCRRSVQALQQLASERAVDLRLLCPPGVILLRGDDMRLAQVVRNLVHNAVRHTPSGGRVTVQLTTDGADLHRHIRLSVADSGPGVPLADRERIFERFYRGQAAEMPQARGSGLGLAICRAIVAAHGGSIRVEDAMVHSALADHPGACFVVILPVGAILSDDESAAQSTASARYASTALAQRPAQKLN